MGQPIAIGYGIWMIITEYVVTLTATDNEGFTDECSETIMIEDKGKSVTRFFNQFPKFLQAI